MSDRVSQQNQSEESNVNKTEQRLYNDRSHEQQTEEKNKEHKNKNEHDAKQKGPANQNSVVTNQQSSAKGNTKPVVQKPSRINQPR